MTKQIKEQSIAELVLNFIAYEVSQYDEKNAFYLETKIQIVEEILDNYAVETDIEVNRLLRLLFGNQLCKSQGIKQ